MDIGMQPQSLPSRLNEVVLGCKYNAVTMQIC